MSRRLYSIKKEFGIGGDDRQVPDVNNIINKVNDALNAGPAERKIIMKKRLLSLSLAAVIILTLTGITVMAATFSWHDRLIEYFDPTEAQMEALQGSVNTPEAAAEDNGYTVNVLQTIADKHGIYVFYEVTAPEGIVFDENIHWRSNILNVNTSDHGDTEALGMGMFKVIETDGNKMTAMEYLEGENAIANNQEITLELEDLMTYKTMIPEETKEEIIGKCRFDLSWKLSYEDMTQTIDVNQKVNIAPGAENTLEKIDISPMSVWITIDGDDKGMQNRPVINFKDGTKLDFIMESPHNTDIAFANHSGKSGGILSVSYRFDRITDISEIESITIGELTVPVSQ